MLCKLHLNIFLKFLDSRDCKTELQTNENTYMALLRIQWLNGK